MPHRPPPGPASGGRPEVEHWFVAHGLPYFVDDIRAQVVRRMGRRRLAAVLAAGLLLGALVGLPAGLAAGEVSLGLATGTTTVLVVAGVYALRALRADVIAGWAVRRAFGSLGLLLPLATRALPMLLLFITFLFINAEVWQVGASLQGGVLWGTVLFFGVAAVLFLVPRLAEELDRFDDEIGLGDVVDATRGTPLEAAAGRLTADDVDLPADAQVTGAQMVNLVLVLLVAQVVQVLLLSLAVFAFFVAFGSVTIDEEVVASWTGVPREEIGYPLGVEVLSEPLIKVATFLAAFSGLYFTVYAVTDELYRREFFSTVMLELRRAVGARVVYRTLCRRGDGSAGAAGPAG